MSEDTINYGDLGQSGSSYAVYTTQFDPSLLNPMPRNTLRERWKITGKEFVGFDVWNAYEATFLTNSGLPVAGTLKIVYSSDSPYMVESKSMKLYLNSFDMCRMGNGINEAKENYVKQIKHDLESALTTKVSVGFHSSVDYEAIAYPIDILRDYSNLYSMIPHDISEIEFDDFTGDRNHIEMIPSENPAVRFYTNVLRSRCRHTKQKDTGTACIQYDSPHHRTIDPVSFLRQIVSLREVNEFHELCSELLYTQIRDMMTVDTRHESLLVMLLYSRRGGIDINPVRASRLDLIPAELIDVNTLTRKTQGQ